MLIQCLRTSFMMTFLSSSVLAAEPPRGLFKKPIKLSCSHSTRICKTGRNGAGAGTFSDTQFVFAYDAPPGWTLYGVAKAAYIGQSFYDVKVLAQTSRHLTCGWRAEGSKQLFGPGGWVSGYCWSKARMAGR